jgi:thiosulfate dehydrogenase
MRSTLIICGVAGMVIVGAAWRLDARREASATMATEDYGRRLITETSTLIGPDQPDPAMRYTGSRLQCGSCHLKAGTEPGTLSLIDVDSRYPRPSGRDGGIGDIKVRVNGCMTRSMNGRALPLDSPEMNAMVAYLRALNSRFKIMDATRRAVHEPKAFAMPDRAASPAAGQVVFEARCARCHGKDGFGLRAENDPSRGYVYPPLWGDDSFNDGAGTHRVLTAAKFIKARMPLGQADLTDDEAFDVAAYINVQPRPAMANLDKDYPDRTTKTADPPYGPYADPFPIEQHRLGPFKPIDEFYAKLKGGKTPN